MTIPGRLPTVRLGDLWKTAVQRFWPQRRYSGVNVLILWGAVIERGFTGQSWLTFHQALGLGGNVRKGEHGTTVVYANRFVRDEERRRAERDGDKPDAIPFLKRFTVFNTDQCENLPVSLTTAP